MKILSLFRTLFARDEAQFADALTIVPEDSRCVLPDAVLEQLCAYLRKTVSAQELSSFSGQMQFVDCGGDLERICCPHCGSEIDMELWAQWMEDSCETDFAHTQVTLPCCGQTADLNALEYDRPCALAFCGVQMQQVEYRRPDAVKQALEAIAKVPLRLIFASY